MRPRRTVLLPALLAGAAFAQDAPPATRSFEISLPDVLREADTYPPPIRLGLRAHAVRETQLVVDALLIVDSPENAASAIAMWRGLVRFPVLIDDGSLEAGENIARFVRAFKPGRVVRWDPVMPAIWPADQTERARTLMQLQGMTLGIDPPPKVVRELVDKMRELRIGPQGVVAVDLNDPAWIGAFALAAGRIQPMIFMERVGRINGMISGNDMRALAELIQAQLRALELQWGELGDEIDSVTIAANMGLRVGLGPDGKDEKALTDLIGRHRAGVGTRWAWSGVLFGDAQTALYRAMCGLFLSTNSAWLFDGYGRGDPWDLYDATTAARRFNDTSYSAVVHDVPANRVSDWRTAVSRGIDAGLILINSRGNMNFFELSGEKAWAGDVPPLARPAAIHLVHSWSARSPGSTRTVAGRWLEHGAYLFYGSIDEPFLNAFVHTPMVATRLLGGLPFGVACRQDDAPPWKLNVLGDPLTTFIADSTAGRRIELDLPMTPLRPLGEAASGAIREEDFARGIRALVLAGRDADAARLAEALLRQRPDAITEDAARWAIMPLFRDGREDALADAYARLSPGDARIVILQDALWHTARRVLARGPDTRWEGLLRRNLRDGQEEHDAVEVAGHIARRAGPGEAVHFLEGVSPDLGHERQQRVLSEAIRRYGGNSRP